MEYTRFENTYLLRLDKGEEILGSIRLLCRKEGVKLAMVRGQGEAMDVSLSAKNRQTFAAKTVNYRGDMEMTSCTGTITSKNGMPYLNLYAVIANPSDKFCLGGHLERGVISLNGEFVITTIRGMAERVYSPQSGMDVLTFET